MPGRYGAAGLALAIVAAAYMAETIRAGIQAVPKGQTEAARSLGMSSTRPMVSIVIPQAFRIIIPPLTNELVLLLKDSSLVYVLGTTAETIELAKYGRDAVVQDVQRHARSPWWPCSTWPSRCPLTRLAAWLERRGGAPPMTAGDRAPRPPQVLRRPRGARRASTWSWSRARSCA